MNQTRKARMQMCSRLTGERGEDIVGHAFNYDRIVVAEMPKPWPRDTSRTRGLTRIQNELSDRFYEFKSKVFEEQGHEGVTERGLDVALHHVAPDSEYSRPGYTRVWHLTRPVGSFSAYSRDEYLVPDTDVQALLEALLYRRSIQQWKDALTKGVRNARDLLVCTHGSIDTCCATFGYPMYQKLRDLADRSRPWRGHAPGSGGVPVPQSVLSSTCSQHPFVPASGFAHDQSGAVFPQSLQQHGAACLRVVIPDHRALGYRCVQIGFAHVNADYNRHFLSDLHMGQCPMPSHL